MIREIKLRAWDKNSNSFVYLNIIKNQPLPDSTHEHGNLNNTDLEDWELYTGSKDINDKEIFRGDLIKLKKETLLESNVSIREGIFQVKYGEVDLGVNQGHGKDNRDFRITGWYLDDGNSSNIFSFYHDDGFGSKIMFSTKNAFLEIIGNIHQDPELLELIECSCNDPGCNISPGEENGEVRGHIYNCPCGECHTAIGKVSPFIKS